MILTMLSHPYFLQRIKLFLVSYESMMHLKGTYIQILYKQLDIEFEGNIPQFKNGNLKYRIGKHRLERRANLLRQYQTIQDVKFNFLKLFQVIRFNETGIDVNNQT